MTSPQEILRRITVVLNVLILIKCGYGSNEINRQRIIDDLLLDYDPRVSPNFNKKEPVHDRVQIFVLSIDSISDSTMDYTMSIFLRQRWRDHRLSYNDSGVDVLELDTRLMDKIWVPDLYIINEKNADYHYITVPNKMMNIFPDGLISYSARVTGTFSCYMDFHKYPLDKQICNIRMESYGHSTSTLVIRWNDIPAILSPNMKMIQFTIEKTVPFLCDQSYMEFNYTCIGLELHLVRSYGYYVIQIYIPTTLIVLLSWISFWLDVEATAARISLGLLTVLAMTTQSASTCVELQRVSYIKALDVWLAICLIFVFSALIEFAYVNISARVAQRRKSIGAVSTLSEKIDNMIAAYPGLYDLTSKAKDKSQQQRSSREKARTIDRYARMIFPIIFLVFNIIYWTFYILWEPVTE